MKISVALCTYNGESFIKEQIESIFAQTVLPDQVIICDDNSHDKTLEILNSYKNKYHCIEIISNKNQIKSIKNFELAITFCHGDIVFLCDQDDYWLPNKIELVRNYFIQNLHIEAICTNGHPMDEKSYILDNYFVMWDVFYKYKQEHKEVDLFNFLTQKGNFATGATMAFRKNLKQQILPIPEIPNFHHDYWIALIASSQNSLEFLNDKLIHYRIHNSQQIGGVAYDKDHYSFEEQYSYFSHNEIENKDFKTLKKILKSQANWYNNYLQIIKTQSKKSTFDIIRNKFFEEFEKNNQFLRKNNLIKYYFLQVSDKILKKRQLKF